MNASVNHLILFQRLDDQLVWLEAAREGKAVKLLSAGAQPFDVDGEHLTLKDAVAQASKHMQAGIWVRYEAVLAAPAHRLTARIIEAPPAEDDQVRDLVAFEVSEALQVPVEDIAWDYWSPSKQSSGQPKLLWIAARKSILNEWLTDWPSNRIPISQITPSVWALYEFFIRSRTGLLRQPTILVMQEGQRAEIAAADSQAIYYTRTVNLGSTKGPSGADVSQRLAMEVERTLQYVSERLIEGEIRSLVIAGFSDLSTEAFDALSAHHSLTYYQLGATDFSVEFDCGGVQPSVEHIPLLAIAYSRLHENLEGVNLLDKQEEALWGARLWEAAQPSPTFIRNAGVMTATALLFWIVSALWFNNAVDARLSEGKSLLELANHLETEEIGLRSMAQRGTPMADILLFLAEMMSKEKKMLVKSVSFDNKDGVVMSIIGGSNQDVLGIINQMNESKYFRDVVSDRAVMEKDGIVIYLTGKLVAGV